MNPWHNFLKHFSGIWRSGHVLWMHILYLRKPVALFIATEPTSWVSINQVESTCALYWKVLSCTLCGQIRTISVEKTPKHTLESLCVNKLVRPCSCWLSSTRGLAALAVALATLGCTFTSPGLLEYRIKKSCWEPTTILTTTCLLNWRVKACFLRLANLPLPGTQKWSPGYMKMVVRMCFVCLINLLSPGTRKVDFLIMGVIPTEHMLFFFGNVEIWNFPAGGEGLINSPMPEWKILTRRQNGVPGTPKSNHRLPFICCAVTFRLPQPWQDACCCACGQHPQKPQNTEVLRFQFFISMYICFP